MSIIGKLTIVTPANRRPGLQQGHWTYNDYAAQLDDGNHYEIIDGVLYMTPAPGTFHQKTVLKISRQLLTHIEDIKLGQVFIAQLMLS